MKQYTEKAYAKINLSLDITGKREDGYHLLRSVMQTVHLWDEVQVIPNEEGALRVRTDIPGIPENEKNIAGKAVVKLREVTGNTALGADVFIKKAIPSEAGLGGGSADAGAVLRVLGAHFSFSQEILLEAAAKTGADVPFCVLGGTALCEGIGERLTRLPPMPECFIVIAKPAVGASTPAIFQRYDEAPSLRRDSDGVISALGEGSLSALCRRIGNGLADACGAVSKITPPTEELLRDMGAEAACLSGSGTAAYGLFTDKEKALLAVSLLKKKGLFAVLTAPQE